MKFQMGFKKVFVTSTDLFWRLRTFFSFETFSCSLGWAYIHYKGEGDLEHLIVLCPASTF